MCLAIPMQITEKNGTSGKVSQGGVEYTVNFTLLPEAEVGDFVLVHAGFAIQRMNGSEAEKTLQLFDEMLEQDTEDDDGQY